MARAWAVGCEKRANELLHYSTGWWQFWYKILYLRGHGNACPREDTSPLVVVPDESVTIPDNRQRKPPMYILYGTSACHLCELAQDMLNEWAVVYVVEDISESDALFERYGLLIPVLRHADGRELNWPFQPESLGAFLRGA